MLTWFFPRTVRETVSPINGKIRVVEQFGQTAVWVGGFEQSGPMVGRLWKGALRVMPEREVARILVLGLGCGAVIDSLIEKYPKAKITGVEIDPDMIEIGREYFNLGEVPHLKKICEDASSYVWSAREKSFDLILVDLYKGGDGEKFLTNRRFLSGLNRILSKDGEVVFNILTFHKPKYEKEEIIKAVTNIFNVIQTPVNFDYNTILTAGKVVKCKAGG